MSYFEINMNCILQEKPELFRQIQSFQQLTEETQKLSISSEPARDGELYTKIIRNGQEYRLNSNYRPIEEAKRWGMQFHLDSINIVVQMFGLGNGYFLREIRKQLKKGDHIIVVEPCYQVFHHIIENYDISDILSDPRIHLTVSELNTAMFRTLLSEYVHWLNYNSQTYCVHPQYEKCFAKEYTDYLLKIKDYNYLTSVNRNTEAHFGVDIVENILSNYKYLPGSNYLLELREKIPKDAPAIIVAAGPSLDKNIEDLKRAQGKAIIIATDTALRSLYKHGIKADFTVSLDPKKPTSYFEGVGFEQMPVFIQSSTNKEALKHHTGRKIWFGCHDFIDHLYQRFGYQMSRFNSGGSVATAAFSICKSLDLETIILIGQDLAYKGNVTHADGQVVSIHSESEGICYVEGIDGSPVKSRHDWYIYLKWFENAIEETKDTGKVIDATEGGALIHGAEIMTLNEAIDKYCTKTISVSNILNQLAPTFSDQQMIQIKDYLSQAYEDIQQSREDAKEIIEYCDTALRLADKPNYTKKIEDIGKKVVQKNKQVSIRPVYALLDNYIKYASALELENVCKVGSGEEGEFERTYETTRHIFETVESASEEIKTSLFKAMEDFDQCMRSDNNVK